MQSPELNSLVREFFRLLDVIESTDEGRSFRPNYIVSSRAEDGHQLDQILARMKAIVSTS
jgi:hypothetical protein